MKTQLCHLQFYSSDCTVGEKIKREIEDNTAFQFSYLPCQTVLIIQTNSKMKQNQQRKTEPSTFSSHSDLAI